jgi:HD-GYP domain-containing protein (c-di-GMP phosphodiesterase class II)
MSPMPRAARATPLTVRLSLAMTVASFFVAMLVAFLGADRAALQRHEQQARVQSDFARQFAERIAPLLDRADLLRMSMLATAARDLASARLLVLDHSGRVVLDTDLVDGNRQLNLISSTGSLQRTVDQGGVAVRETVSAVRFGGDPIGEVRLQVPMAAAPAVFDLGLFGLVFLCCLSLVAVAGLGAHHWAGRIRRVTDAMVQVATGNPTNRADPNAPREMQQLETALRELERGVQDGLQRVTVPFVALAQQVVEGLEGRKLVPSGHGQRTAGYARLLADRLELLPEDRRDLELACRLQDLGKAFIRPALLCAERSLSSEEQHAVDRHAVLAADHLEALPGLRRAARIVRHQSERYDGCGGPDRLRGDRIPLGARIRVLAAVFDLLTTCGEGSTLSSQQAIERMSEDRGEIYDPWLFDLFAQAIQEDSQHVQELRDVMILPVSGVPRRVDSAAVDEEDLDYDLGQELELMLEDMPPEERA